MKGLEPRAFAIETLLKKQLAEHNRLKKAGRIVPQIFHRNGKPIREFYAAWRTACKHAGCPGKLLHDFRRTAVRNLERAGVSRSAAMKMVGHKTESLYRRYAIVDSGVMHEAAAQLDRYWSLGQKLGQSAPSPSSRPSGRRSTGSRLVTA